MILGRINYLNLLPFYLFLKRYHGRLLQMSNFKKGSPSAINGLYKRRLIDAGFISSIKSRRQKGTNIGIVAKNAVTSVLVLEGEFKADEESATSNALARMLGLKGRVMIGDKALKLYIDGAKTIDLAVEWQNRTGMPFVFSKMCYTKSGKFVKKLSKHFLQKLSRRVPQIVLRDREKKTGIPADQISAYLSRLDYKIDLKAQRALKKFLIMARGYESISYSI